MYTHASTLHVTVFPIVYGFTYDVFVCAHDEVRDWIEERILFPLENGCNPPYKVCWHLRDFIAGLPISEQIEAAVYESRKVALIFSKNFMESKFCRLELKLALYRQFRSGTRCLLPITFGNELVPTEMKSKFTYLQVTGGDEQFTATLIELLGEGFRVHSCC